MQEVGLGVPNCEVRNPRSHEVKAIFITLAKCSKKATKEMEATADRLMPQLQNHGCKFLENVGSCSFLQSSLKGRDMSMTTVALNLISDASIPAEGN